LSPDELSVVPPFHWTGAASSSFAPLLASTSAYVAPGVNVPGASNPVCGLRMTAIFSADVRYPN
jgi:hypothetical protein